MPEVVIPSLTGQEGKFIRWKLDGTGWELADAGGSFTGDSDDIDEGAVNLFLTSAERTKLSNTSGTNTGDQDLSGKADVVHSHDIDDITGLQTALDGKASSLGADDNYVTDAEKTKLSNLSGTNSGDNAVNSLYSGLAASKQDLLTNGFGLTGTTTKAVSLTSASAFATATTAISAATYADIAGCSVTLAAGTWLIMGHVVGFAANTIIQMLCAITDGANAVIAETAQSRPASGTASLNSPISCSWSCIVTPVGSTTYKLRGARGLTTHTGTWTAMDGNGVNTTNHATNNTDKGTSIIAIRIA